VERTTPGPSRSRVVDNRQLIKDVPRLLHRIKLVAALTNQGHGLVRAGQASTELGA
jgi:hypothetical protein